LTPGFRTPLLVLCAAAGLVPAAAQAQGWALSVSAGRTLNDPLSSRVAATNSSLELRYDPADGSPWLYLSGGAPVGSPGPGWGAAGAGALLAHGFGPVSLGVTVGTDLYGYAAASGAPAGGGGTGQLAPTLTLGRGLLRAELRSGLLGTGERIGDSTSWRLMHDSNARLVAGAGRMLQVAAEGRLLRAKEGDYTWAGGSATLSGARGSLWGFGGRWLSSGFPSPAAGYGGGATLRLGAGVETTVSWAQEPVDPVYFSAARRTWSVQLTRRFGPRPVAPAPIPVLPPAADGRVEISLPARDAPGAPSVVGDFTEWRPVAMVRTGNAWTVRLRIAPGTYHYAFRTADGKTFVPASLPQVDDGFGGTSAVLVVQ
jgi:hypothetical protein